MCKERQKGVCVAKVKERRVPQSLKGQCQVRARSVVVEVMRDERMVSGGYEGGEGGREALLRLGASPSKRKAEGVKTYTGDTSLTHTQTSSHSTPRLPKVPIL